MTQSYQALYAEHVDEVQRRWEKALAAERFEAALVHSGTPIISFLDDYEYAFRPNPHFLHWLPLTHHADSALLIRPGRKPALFYYQPDDYWYLPPSDPEPWWADHFNIEIVRDKIDLAEQAPTGGNQGSRRWIVVRDPEVKGRLAGLYRTAIGDFVLGGGEVAAAPIHDQRQARTSFSLTAAGLTEFIRRSRAMRASVLAIFSAITASLERL